MQLTDVQFIDYSQRRTPERLGKGEIIARDTQNIDTVFAGHYHKANTVIDYKEIKLAFGLKTGQYDAHSRYQLGGTRVELFKDGFDICHILALCLCAPSPRNVIRKILKEYDSVSYSFMLFKKVLKKYTIF